MVLPHRPLSRVWWIRTGAVAIRGIPPIPIWKPIPRKSCSLFSSFSICETFQSDKVTVMGIMVGRVFVKHYSDVIIGVMASQITSLTIVYPTVYSGADQRKHQSSASMAFVRGIHQSPVNSPHKWRVTRKMFPFDDISMIEFNLSLGGVSAISRTPV